MAKANTKAKIKAKPEAPSAEIFPDNGPQARAIRCLREWMSDGTFPPGSPLPGERELALRLHINRGTLRNALSVLSEEGLLRSNGARLRLVQSVHAPQPFLENAVVLLTINPDGAARHHRQSGWSDVVDQGAMEAVRAAGMHHLSFHPAHLYDSDWPRVLEAGPRAVILTDWLDEHHKMFDIASGLQRRGVPVAVYGNDPALHPFDRVASDHEAGGYVLTRFCIEQKRRRIVMMGSSQNAAAWFLARRAGYKRALREAGLEVLPLLDVPPLTNPADAATRFEMQSRLVAGYLLEHFSTSPPVDAILAPADPLVPAVTRACALCGKAPGEVLVAGYDNFWADTEAFELYPVRPQATVDKLNSRIGAELVKLALQRADGELPAAPQCRLIEPQLMIHPSPDEK